MEQNEETRPAGPPPSDYRAAARKMLEEGRVSAGDRAVCHALLAASSQDGDARAALELLAGPEKIRDGDRALALALLASLLSVEGAG